MKFRTIAGRLIILIICSCIQHPSKGVQQNENVSIQHLGSQIGLRIENSFRRGTSYTDFLGTNYNLRLIPITMTNDSTITIHLQIAFSKDYKHLPHPDFNESFKLIPLPKEWALNGVGIKEGMIDELPNYIEMPLLNKTIEPGENIVFAIGTLYSNPPTCGIIPQALFTQSDSANFQACDSRMTQDKSTNPQLALGVKLEFCKSCILIPCGQVSYSEH